MMGRTIKDIEGVTLVTDCLDGFCSYLEEMEEIAFRILGAECVRNVAISKVATGKSQSVRVVHLQDLR